MNTRKSSGLSLNNGPGDGGTQRSCLRAAAVINTSVLKEGGKRSGHKGIQFSEDG